MNPYQELTTAAGAIVTSAEALSSKGARTHTAICNWLEDGGAGSRDVAYSLWNDLAAESRRFNLTAAWLCRCAGWIGIGAEFDSAGFQEPGTPGAYAKPAAESVSLTRPPGADLSSPVRDYLSLRSGRKDLLYQSIAGFPFGQRILPGSLGLPDDHLVPPNQDNSDELIPRPRPEDFSTATDTASRSGSRVPAAPGADYMMWRVKNLSLVAVCEELRRCPLAGLGGRMGPWSESDTNGYLEFLDDIERRCRDLSYILVSAAAEPHNGTQTELWEKQAGELERRIGDRLVEVSSGGVTERMVSAGRSLYIGTETHATIKLHSALSELRMSRLANPEGVERGAGLLRNPFNKRARPRR